MDRRAFLRILGGAAAAAAAPTKTYSFLGGILRPRQEVVIDTYGPGDADLIRSLNGQFSHYYGHIVMMGSEVLSVNGFDIRQVPEAQLERLAVEVFMGDSINLKTQPYKH